MKRYFLMISLMLSLVVNQCNSRRCSYDEQVKYELDNDIDGKFKFRMDEIERQYQFTRYRHNQNESRRELIELDDHNDFIKHAYFRDNLEIPVVIHILYNPTDNINLNDIITTQRISSQLSRLNIDFLMKNQDIHDIPNNEGWDKLAANYSMVFKLNHVIRKETHQTIFYDWSINKYAYDYSPNYDEKHNLNIWVINYPEIIWDEFENIIGYDTGGAFTYPIPAERDGIIIDYRVFGDVSFNKGYNNYQQTMSQKWNLGRTLTHEIGHWLNLQHIWGPTNDRGPQTCNDTDYVDDTPNQLKDHYGCPTYDTSDAFSCNSNDMFMNYMDYVDDDCYRLFTKGQQERSFAILDKKDGARRELVEYQNVLNNGEFINHIYILIGDVNKALCPEIDHGKGWIGYMDNSNSHTIIQAAQLCYTTTTNNFIDVITDIQPINQYYSMQQAKQNGYDYCVETQVHTLHLMVPSTHICYKKGSFTDNKRVSELDQFIFYEEDVPFTNKFGTNQYQGYTLKYLVYVNGVYHYLGYQ